MMFCPRCRALMYPKKDLYLCNKCGFKTKKTGSKIIISEQKKREITFIEDKNKINVLPKIKIKCPKCGNNEAYWILRQMRGSDEPESRFYNCINCNYKWRED